ncbi:MAG: hypothetical protein ACRD8O_02355, partial [Bryobacteraceae bacterium]
MRERPGIGQIVDRDEFNVTAVDSCANDIPADTAKAVDRNFHWHVWGSLLSRKKPVNPKDNKSRVQDTKVAGDGFFSEPRISRSTALCT